MNNEIIFILTEQQVKKLANTKQENNNPVIVLSEEQLDYVLSESFHPKSSMVLMVKGYLDKNFNHSYIDDMDTNGYPQRIPVVVWVNSNGDSLKTLSTDDLLSMLDDKFNSLIKDDDDRRRFLKQVIKDWFRKKITHDGLLSVNIV